MTSEQEEQLARLYKIRDSLSSYSDYDSFSIVLRDLLPSIPIRISDFFNQPYAFGQGTETNWIFRARPILPGEKRWDHVEEIGYLPVHLSHCSPAGRAHRKGDRVFYGSLNYYAACIETYSSGSNLDRVVKGESHECIVGAWKVEKPIRFASLPYAEQSVLALIKRRKFIPHPGNPVTEEGVKKQAAHTRAMVNDEFKYKVLEFFAEAFARQGDEQYMLSTYYAERVLDKLNGFRAENEVAGQREAHPFEGIFYYAVPSSYEIHNVVMKTDAVDEKLTFSHAYHLAISYNLEYNNTNWVKHESRVPAVNGVIQWKKNYQVSTPAR